MKATRKDHVILKCARRLINKLDAPQPRRYYTLNGEFAKDVQVELKRLKTHCLHESLEQARKEKEEWT